MDVNESRSIASREAKAVMAILVVAVMVTSMLAVSAPHRGAKASIEGALVQPNWTIAVYCAADNDLEKLAIDDFIAMANLGSSSTAQIVMLLDRTPLYPITGIDGYSSDYGNWSDTRLFKIQQYDTPVPEKNYAGWDPHERDMGNPATLVEFGNFVLDNFVSSHYAFILLNHGGGYQGVCYDMTDPVDCLQPGELRTAFGQIYAHKSSKIDLVAFDACMMGESEVLYCLAGYVDVAVASEYISFNSLPYSYYSGRYDYPPWVLDDLAANPSMTAQELGAVMARDYVETNDGSFGDQLIGNSSVGVWNIDALTSAAFLTKLNEFSMGLIEARPVFGVQIEDIRANKTVRSWYMYDDMIDLGRFADQIADPANNVNDQDLRNAASALSAYVKDPATRYAYYNYTTIWGGVQYPFPYHAGLSIYFPCRSWSQGYLYEYGSMSMSVASLWDDNLRAYFHYWGSETSAPTTIIPQNGESGILGQNGWWESNVGVTLSRSDVGGSGVLYTRYKLDASPWQVYSGPITVSGEGQHTLQYFSVDRVGNVEATHSKTYQIDTTAPVTTATVDGPRVTLTASDPLVGSSSGVSATYYWLDGGTRQTYTAQIWAGFGAHTVVYHSVDAAGNVESNKTVTTSEYRPTIQEAPTVASGDELDGKFTLTWKTAVDPDTTPVAGYYVYESVYSNGVWSAWSIVGGPMTGTSLSLTKAPGSYMYRVQAYDTAGWYGDYSPNSRQIDVPSAPPGPPVTTASVQETIVNGWYITTPTVTLTAVDPDGISATYYKIDSARRWTTYKTPFTVSTGAHVVTFYSVDKLNNQETAQSINVRFDPTVPSTSMALSAKKMSVTLSVTDVPGAVITIHYQLDGGTWKTVSGSSVTIKPGAGSHTIAFYAEDAPGWIETQQTKSFTF